MKYIPYKIKKFKKYYIEKIFESNDVLVNYGSKPRFLLYCSKDMNLLSYVAVLDDDNPINPFSFLESGVRKAYYKDGSDALLLTRGL